MSVLNILLQNPKVEFSDVVKKSVNLSVDNGVYEKRSVSLDDIEF